MSRQAVLFKLVKQERAALLWCIWVNTIDVNENEHLENHSGIWPQVFHFQGGINEAPLEQNFGFYGMTSLRIRVIRVFTWFRFFSVSHFY